MPKSIACYRTIRGANRYAAELRRVWADKLANAVTTVHPHTFGYAVRVTTKDGNMAYAAPRPRNFGRA